MNHEDFYSDGIYEWSFFQSPDSRQIRPVPNFTETAPYAQRLYTYSCPVVSVRRVW